jgi:methanogenic corrinoid protein MtbC1
MGALLRRRLWSIIYLGQAVPLPDLASFVREVNPHLVVLVAMTEETASNLIDWTNWLHEAATRGRPVVGFGGRIFVEKPEWRLKVPGIYLGSTFEEGILTIEKLLR